MDTITDGNLNSAARHSESWTLDALGNWTGSAAVTIDGTAQSRTLTNAGNQYTAVGGATPAYDSNGNMTTDETGKDYTYDAWNRLVKVDSIQVTYGYTALGQRAAITGCAASTTYSYFSVNWQNLEDDVVGGCGGYSKSTYVWGLGYIDDLVARTDAAGTTLYVQQDAAFNVTALINTSGSVVERFVYDPYGQATVLASNWTTTSDSYNWVYRYKGGRYDTYSGLYNFRYRDYSPTLGRWMQEDPAGYVDGANLYQAYLGAPIGMVDPMGLAGGPSTNPSGGTTQPTTQPVAPLKLRVGFFGLGPNTTYGDTINEDIARSVGGKMYDWENVDQAVAELLEKLDVNGDHRIDASEIRHLDLRVSGYSRGGKSAIQFVRKLNMDKEQVGSYRLDVKVPVKVLVTMDPADFLPVPSVTNNVDTCVNYYQQHGGTTSVTDVDRQGVSLGSGRVLGNAFSSVVKGVAVQGAANHRVDSLPASRFGEAPDNRPWNPHYIRVYSKDVNHDTLPWYVEDRVRDLLTQP